MRIVTRRRGFAALVAVALAIGSLSFAGSASADPPPQTFTWATPANSTYGVGLSATQLDAVSNVAGATVYSVVTGPGSTAGMTIVVGTVLPAGNYGLKATFTPTDTTDYVTKTATVSLTIDKAKLGVQANNAARAYGAANPTFTIAPYTGLVNGDTAAVVTGAPVLTTTATTSSPVGSYPINVAQGTLAAANYTFVLLSGDLEVGTVTLTVTASNGTQTYGDTTAPVITPSYSGFVNGDTAASLTSTPTCTANVNNGTPVGSYVSSCIGGSSPNYALQFVAGTVTVTRATLTVTASNGSQTYGDATAPVITPIYSGFRNLDDASDLTSLPTCVANVTSASVVGTYTSSCSGGAGNNYTLQYATGTVTVGQATLTVTASNGAQTYGDALPPPITPSYSGFVNGQGTGVLSAAATCSANVIATTPAGTYASTCSGASAPNYAVQYVSGTVTVAQAPLTVTASGGTQVYGDLVPPTISPSYSGFLNGDDPAALSQAPSCTAGVTATTPAGTHASSSSCSGGVAANYTFNYVNGTVVVTKAVLTAKADDATRPFGAANPPFALSAYSGFKNGDTSADLTGAPVISTTANASSQPGTYPITVAIGTLSATNYTFVLSPGTLTVDKIIEPVTVVGRAVNKLSVLFYGTVTAPDGTLVVLQNVNCTTLVGGTPITKTLAFGTYAIDGTSCSFIPIIDAPEFTTGAVTGTFTAAQAGITTVTLPPGVLGQAYPPLTKLSETGASGTATWSIVGGALPTGMSLSTAGVLSGTPTASGVFQFTVKVVVGAALNETWTYSITVPPLGVTTASLANGQIGVTYRQTLTSNVAKTPAHWSKVAGSLPPGLALATNGVISGKPTAAGTFSFTIQVADSASPAHTATRVLSITIAPMTITTASLKSGKVHTFYSVTLAASGGITPRTWAVISGALPTGLHISTAGTISGTPTAAGSYTFTVRATDHAGNTADATFTVVIV